MYKYVLTESADILSKTRHTIKLPNSILDGFVHDGPEPVKVEIVHYFDEGGYCDPECPGQKGRTQHVGMVWFM